MQTSGAPQAAAFVFLAHCASCSAPRACAVPVTQVHHVVAPTQQSEVSLPCRFLMRLPQLKVLWLSDNPCAAHPAYRATAVRNLPGLVSLEPGHSPAAALPASMPDHDPCCCLDLHAPSAPLPHPLPPLHRQSWMTKR